MTYPIFNSFVNRIQNELESREIAIKTFKTWHEDRINATGLEILIDIQTTNNFIKEVAINFDWDRFRETALATQLEGLGEHPMLQEENLKSVSVTPKIDVEVSWIFDEQKSQIARFDASENDRLKQAGNWMKSINKKVNALLRDDEIITRWHLELEGNGSGKHISLIWLISYFQYSFSHLKTLNEAHQFISKQLESLLVTSKRVREISDNTVENAA